MSVDDSTLRALFKAASKAKSNSYSPYSNHPVGASVLMEDGTIYAGTNVETANYDGLCAEASAIGAMRSASGGERIKAVAVVGPGDAPCTPCGRCRQRIREFGNASTGVYIFSSGGTLLQEHTMGELLPHDFGPDNLKNIPS